MLSLRACSSFDYSGRVSTFAVGFFRSAERIEIPMLISLYSKMVLLTHDTLFALIYFYDHCSRDRVIYIYILHVTVSSRILL